MKTLFIIPLLFASLVFPQTTPKVNIALGVVTAKLGDVSTIWKHVSVTVNYTVTNNTAESLVQVHGMTLWNPDMATIPLGRKALCINELKSIRTAITSISAGNTLSDYATLDSLLVDRTVMLVGCVAYKGSDGIVHTTSFKRIFVPELDPRGAPVLTQKHTLNGSVD